MPPTIHSDISDQAANDPYKDLQLRDRVSDNESIDEKITETGVKIGRNASQVKQKRDEEKIRSM